MIPFSGRKVLVVHAGGPGLTKLKRALAALGRNGFRVIEIEARGETAVQEGIDLYAPPTEPRNEEPA